MMYYLDETGISEGTYTIIGGLYFDNEKDVEEVNRIIADIKYKFNFGNHEIKWRKLIKPREKLPDMYFEIISEILEKLHIIAVVDYQRPHNFVKMYENFIKTHNDDDIFIDKNLELEKFLRDKKYGNIYFENSVNNNLIQIADLMIGAISYCKNDKSYRNIYSNGIAQKFINTIKTQLNIDDLMKNNIVKIIDLTE